MRRLLANFGWLSGEMLARLFAGLAVMTLVARALGPAGFGAYSWAIGLAVLVLPLARFGMEPVVMRRIAAAPDKGRSILRAAMGVTVPAMLLAALVGAALFAMRTPPEGVTATIVALALVAVLVSPGESFATAVKAREQVGRFAAMRIAVIVAIAAVTAWAAIEAPSLEALVALRSAEAVLAAVAGIAAWLMLSPIKPASRAQPDARALSREGFPLMIATLCMAGVMRVDQLMLGWMVGEAELGQYGLAARLAELAWFVPVVLQATLTSATVRNHADPAIDFETFSQRVLDIFALAAWPVVAVTALGCALLLVPVFGADYAPALAMVLALSAATPLYFLYFAFGTLLTVRGLVWQSAGAAALAAAVNIALNAVLIPLWGWAGAAIATWFAFLFATIVAALLFPETRAWTARLVRALDPVSASRRLWALYGAQLREALS